MRILFDIQGAQNDNSVRGIGRYVLSLAKALASQPRGHDVQFLLSAAFPEKLHAVKAAIEAVAGPQTFHLFHPFERISGLSDNAAWRRAASEEIRNAAIAAARPDCVLVGSVFDGFGDDTAITIHDNTAGPPTAVVLHDLIPLVRSEFYLADELMRLWYMRRLAQLRRADAWLSNSEHTRREGIALVGLIPERSFNIGAAADQWEFSTTKADATTTLNLHRISRDFILYTGGNDWRKNLFELVEAFADLPRALRKRHQLVFAGRFDPAGETALRQHASAKGVAEEETIFTGYIPDSELEVLYARAALFVMPSRHEGFGLPPLEAMSHGAPTIAANSSSLPEVIGWADALFSLDTPNAMRDKMVAALTDEAFRAALKAHGPKQAAKFSWARTADLAFDALEAMAAPKKLVSIATRASRPRLAFVSPLPPSKSGISVYSAELLPALTKHYDIDIVTTEPTSVAREAWRNQLSPSEFDLVASHYDRIVYQIGNSPFHRHMLDHIRRHPGVAVLHDFFLPWPILNEVKNLGGAPEPLVRALYDSGGFPSLAGWNSRTAPEIARDEPMNLNVMNDALGVIVHSKHALDLAKKYYPLFDEKAFARIPLLRAPARLGARVRARAALGVPEDALIVATFGFVDASKRSREICEAWAMSRACKRPGARLVFAGANDGGEYGAGIASIIASATSKAEITGWLDEDAYRNWLAAADIAIQLRRNSRGETSAAALDCLNFSLPTIVNAHGSMAELPVDNVIMLEEEPSLSAIAAAIDRLAEDAGLRAAYAAAGRRHIETEHSPFRCADAYRDAIEAFCDQAKLNARAGARRMAAEPMVASIDDWARYAGAAALSAPPAIRQRRILLDCSNIIHKDLQTGIQRVLRNVARNWLQRRDADHRVELVFAPDHDVYRFARRLACAWLGIEAPGLNDDALDIQPGDVVLLIDSAWDINAEQRPFYQRVRMMGGAVVFIVYDLLPVLAPHYFPDFAINSFNGMMQALAECDGAICISRSVASELEAWIAESAPHRSQDFAISWFHLGADLEAGSTDDVAGLPDDVAHALGDRLTFLMVGTVEPRKGHTQTLAAFERLWRDGVDVNLVIVGKAGWMNEKTTEALQSHAETGARLHWFIGAPDDLLAALYQRADALIAASEAEGFGLPLIEAARKKKPVIARDIPVFREVAGEHAFYFSGDDAKSLADALRAWIELSRRGAHPQSVSMPVMTWDESADQLWERMLAMTERSAPPNSMKTTAASASKVIAAP